MLTGLFCTMLMGITLGVFGAGGSILTVPILVFLMSETAEHATAYSLFIVGVTALIGALSYYKEKLICFKIGLIFGLSALAGVYLVRFFLMPAIPDSILHIGTWELTKNGLILSVFSVVMIMAAYTMIKPTRLSPELEDKEKRLSFPLIALEALVVGGVTGFVGAGGGFLIIPALVVIAGLGMKQAVGTSLMIIAIKSILGFMGDIQIGMKVDWGLLLEVTGLAILGIIVGGLVARKIDGNKLRPAFGYFVFIMGIGMLMQAFI